jgi:hypothetical protein
MNTNKKNAENAEIFYCLFCNFECIKKSNYNTHLLTRKHEILTNPNYKNADNYKQYFCNCGKKYNHASSLSTHKKKCVYKKENNTNTDNDKDKDINLKSMFMQIIEENKELRKQITELIPIVGNNNNNTNNVKQRFNINIFLNEKCKNAISIDQFVEKIEVSMKNLLSTKEHGLGIGLSNIIIDNLNKLSLYERPIHCTDKKRETLYIKNNEWEKDNDKQKVNDLLKRVENKQIKSIKKWTDEHPNFVDNDKLLEEYMNLIRGCTSSIEACKEKAIKKLCENIYITE